MQKGFYGSASSKHMSEVTKADSNADISCPSWVKCDKLVVDASQNLELNTLSSATHRKRKTQD